MFSRRVHYTWLVALVLGLPRAGAAPRVPVAVAPAGYRRRGEPIRRSRSKEGGAGLSVALARLV